MPVATTSYGNILVYTWSPDSQAIAAAEQIDKDSSILVLLEPSGNRRELASLERPVRELRWSPDGQIAVKLDDGSLLSVNASSGAITDLGQLDGDYEIVDWLPDGGLFVSRSGQFMEFSPHREGRLVHQAEAYECCGHPALSPDKSVLAWSSLTNDLANQGLWLTDTKTGATHLLAATGLIVDIAWSKDGTRIAYGANPFQPESPSGTGTFVIAATGGDPQQLTQMQGTESESIISWNPDGTAVVVRRRPDFNCKYNCEIPQLFMVSLDGAEVELGLDKSLLAFGFDGSIGRDGDSLVFFPSNASPGRVLDTGNEIEKFKDAAFSPDGEWLSFMRFACWSCDRPPGR